MLFLTRRFGVTASDADRDPVREKADIEEIVAIVCCYRRNPPLNNTARSVVEPM